MRKVREKVLKVFHSLYPGLDAREMEHFVASFIDIQYGNVSAKNVPTKWLKDHPRILFDILSWKDQNEGDWVDILP